HHTREKAARADLRKVTLGGGTNRSAEPGRGQLENRNVTINSHLTYTNLTDAAQSKTRRGRRRGSVLGRSSKEEGAERHEEGISWPSTLARKKAPPTKRGQGRVVMCAGGCLGGESQPPARVPKSHMWNWFHGPFGRAHRRPGAKENAGVRDQDGAGSSRGDSKHEQRSGPTQA